MTSSDTAGSSGARGQGPGASEEYVFTGPWPLAPGPFLPVLLVMDVTLELDVGLVRLEAAALQDLDDAQRLRINPGAGLAVLLGHADHLRIAAQEHVRPGRIERLAQSLLEIAARQHVLDVHLVVDRVLFTRRQRDV